MPKPSEQAHVNFISECLRKGEQRKAIMGKFGKKWANVSRTTFDRRFKQAKEAVAGEQAAIQAKAEQEVLKEVEVRKASIMSAIERQELLTQIAKGEVTVKKPVVIAGAVKLVPVEPDHGDRIKAIRELSNMDGAYVSAKIDVTSGGEKINQTPSQLDLSKLSTEQLQVLLDMKEKLKQ